MNALHVPKQKEDVKNDEPRGDAEDSRKSRRKIFRRLDILRTIDNRHEIPLNPPLLKGGEKTTPHLNPLPMRGEEIIERQRGMRYGKKGKMPRTRPRCGVGTNQRVIR